MGVDVNGKSPATKEGKYFGNNWTWWRPLAYYICEVAPEIASRCTYWHANDGDGLNAEDSLALADKLQEEIDSGRTERYAVIFAAEHEPPNEPCGLCKGTRICRVGPANDVFECLCCGGSGWTPPDYLFSTDNVRQFVAFLRGCGGFAIW